MTPQQLTVSFGQAVLPLPNAGPDTFLVESAFIHWTPTLIYWQLILILARIRTTESGRGPISGQFICNPLLSHFLFVYSAESTAIPEHSGGVPAGSAQNLDALDGYDDSDQTLLRAYAVSIPVRADSSYDVPLFVAAGRWMAYVVVVVTSAVVSLQPCIEIIHHVAGWHFKTWESALHPVVWGVLLVALYYAFVTMMISSSVVIKWLLLGKVSQSGGASCRFPSYKPPTSRHNGSSKFCVA